VKELFPVHDSLLVVQVQTTLPEQKSTSRFPGLRGKNRTSWQMGGRRARSS
jgi:hypothetical protein